MGSFLKKQPALSLIAQLGRKAIQALRDDPSGKLLVFATLNFLRPSRLNWKPAEYVNEQRPSSATHLSIAFTFHIFYEEYVEKLISGIRKLEIRNKFIILVTTPSIQVKRAIESQLGADFPMVEVTLVQNRGRNFGPMLVEYHERLQEFDLVVHLHSKKSLHLNSSLAQAWADESWKLLFEEPKLLERCLAIMSSRSDLGILYSSTRSFMPPKAFGWGGAKDAAKAWFSSHPDISIPSGRFPFPAGGMFLARAKAIQPVLETPFSYEDFPIENGQLDGTYQHAIERIIGIVPRQLGFVHCTYIHRDDRFTADESFVFEQKTAGTREI